MLGSYHAEPVRPSVLLLTFFRSKLRALLTLLLLSCLAFFILSLVGPLNKGFTKRKQATSIRPNHLPFATPASASPPRRLHPDDYPGSKLLHLPILVTTSNEPFDTRLHPAAGYKPLKDSYEPFDKSSELHRRLSVAPTSKDPPKSLWPPLTYPQPAARRPPPLDQIENYQIASASPLPPTPSSSSPKLPPVQWEGFFRHNWESKSQKQEREKRREWVRNAFLHVWEGYKEKAWGHDELKPISGQADDPFSGWGATLVDCLDTLIIMKLPNEYKHAREHVRTIDWSHAVSAHHTSGEPTVPFFETVIRYLGGLISAYELSGDSLMLTRAEDLANWLLPAFGTFSGFPVPYYQLGTNPRGQHLGRVILAQMGSLSLEFTRLSQITKKPHYFYYVQRITDHLDSQAWKSNSRIGTLFPTFVDPENPGSFSGVYSFGGMADSYYEYLIKQNQLLGGHPQYSRMYTDAIKSGRQYLIQTVLLEGPSSPKSKKITIIGDRDGNKYIPQLDHLTCFAGAMIGLGARLLESKDDLDLAVSYTDSCVWAYETSKTGLGAERMKVLDGGSDQARFWEPVEYLGRTYRRLKAEPIPGADVLDAGYLGRPETIESVFYMWRITGNRVWQDRGWRMFTSWMESCFSEFGFANLKDVNSDPPDKDDKQESFVLAETFKYYYLLFSDPSTISLDEYVLNTEAHPFRLGPPQPSHNYQIDGLDDFGEGEHDGTGTVLQAWSRIDIKKLPSQLDKALYQNVLDGKS